MNTIFYSEFDPGKIASYGRVPKPIGNQQTKERPDIIDCVCAFDIETSVYPGINQAVVYMWQFSMNNDVVIIGRTLKEYLHFINQVSLALGDKTMIIYVHNLSYEFQFLRGVYDFKEEDVFALEPRKILKVRMFGNIEYRCSYLLTNCKLSVFCKEMRVEHQKIDTSAYDHTKVRYPWTPWESFSDLEQEYMLNDVIGLVEALQAKMKLSGDTLHTIPLTSTGYVRRDVKRAMRGVIKTCVDPILPDIETYIALREAFRGGDTHANRYYAGEVLNNIKSRDRSSSYPDVIVHCEFPMSPFKPFRPGVLLVDVLKSSARHHRAFLLRVGFTGVKLRDVRWGMPYLATAKCRHIINGRFDNGRILTADYLETTVTDIDLRIILETYTLEDSQVIWGKYSNYGSLPQELKNTVIKYYKDKTELKNVEGRELIYSMSKALLNSIYGMMAQDPVKADVLYIENDYKMVVGDISKKLDKYNSKAFLPYQWGVWTTAHARYRLYESYLITGEGTVYADTDSNKFLAEYDNPKGWEEYNEARKLDCLKSGAYATDKHGEVHYMGVFEEETTDNGYYEFKTLGAKKYAYRENPESECVITIAGVPKKDGAKELDAAGGVKAFQDGMIFRAGKVQIVYNDDNYGWYNIDGHDVYITSNAAILPNAYTVGITDEYSQLLCESHEYRKKIVTDVLYSKEV